MAVDYFLKLDGIPGESQDTNHKGEIQISSWSWGASQVSSVAGTGGSGAGKVDLADITVMKTLDKASVPFFKSICAGTHIKTGTLTAVKSGADGKPYLKVDFEELFVTALHVSASSEVPSESVTFSYNQVKIAYSTQDDKGTITLANQATYNVKGNKLS
jgi:type VI secretion system secreted protein Hcp